MQAAKIKKSDYRALEYAAKIQLSRISFWDYCSIKAPSFYHDGKGYLKEVCSQLQTFLFDETDVFILNMPPRFGKSRTACNYVEWIFGVNPKLKVMIGSYNEILSTTFSTTVRDCISEAKTNPYDVVYSDIFPDTKVKRGDAAKNIWSLQGSEVKSYLATSPTGTATGFGADIIIIDDLIKSAMEANNSAVLAKQWEWFCNTMYSRLQGVKKLLIIMTQWATQDLAHCAASHFKSIGLNVKTTCINATLPDGSMTDETVLPRRHYEALSKTIAPNIFRANYHNEAIDMLNAAFGNFKTYTHAELESVKDKFTKIIAQTDTADEGTDYLCQIIGGRVGDVVYVLDVYYTKEPMEITELEAAKRVTQYRVNYDRTESNNGGKGFARNKQRIAREKLHNTVTKFEWKQTTSNKEAKILTNVTSVCNTFIFPNDWAYRWSEFYNELRLYSREGGNAHDDGADCITEMYLQEFEKPKFTIVGGI